MTEYILIGSSLLCCIAVLAVLLRMNAMGKEMQELRRENQALRRENQEMIQQSFHVFGEMISGNQKAAAENLDQRLFELNTRFSHMAVENEQKLENIRGTIEKKITDLTEDNNRQLSEMRQQVYKGLGEMQNLAAGVGDLKKVLSNVKTRGILGEVQLSAILEQILSPDQYEENVRTKSTGSERVEFAVRLPGDDDGVVWLPIDAKFPADAYSTLVDAYDAGDAAAVEAAAKNLERVIKSEARDIHEKYVEPPYTTDFAIMFLPFEGLYAEVVRRGLLEVLQRDYKISIAGPTTMAALLNSLQMGFRTLAIQKHSSQVWDVLGAVKTEFDKFGTVLAATQARINQANAELDKLIGTRTRSIQRKLRGVTAIDQRQASQLLELDDLPAAEYEGE